MGPKAEAMLRAIWSHQKDDARGAMRVYITLAKEMNAPWGNLLAKAM